MSTRTTETTVTIVGTVAQVVESLLRAVNDSPQGLPTFNLVKVELEGGVLESDDLYDVVDGDVVINTPEASNPAVKLTFYDSVTT